jgi:Predicted small metal-binding protein
MARPKKASLSFACKDIGMDCGFTATASSEEELMAKIAEHARTAHNMQI